MLALGLISGQLLLCVTGNCSLAGGCVNADAGKAWDKVPVEQESINPSRHFPSAFLTATLCLGLIYSPKGSLSINRASRRNEALVIAFRSSPLPFPPQ